MANNSYDDDDDDAGGLKKGGGGEKENINLSVKSICVRVAAVALLRPLLSSPRDISIYRSGREKRVCVKGREK